MGDSGWTTVEKKGPTHVVPVRRGEGGAGGARQERSANGGG
eukprot:CAMPEP_0197595628 /NCGR_PEP_ID=MMETSP1326-20131121/23325_1 /TAXON_ID=1155430 /ORGANISM="Genus nov. species nov., Strain RCC2288" /LENGTH=40 /DNA_ID= /DNA_START= /DNA_END= /DNA_ORIENTATION=